VRWKWFFIEIQKTPSSITLVDDLYLYPYYQYGNVLFVDGHVKECKKERWEEIIKKNNFTY